MGSLTMLVMILAAFLMPRASGPHAWKTAWRDGPKHKSPNAGRPEATMAGALSFGLGGPRKYAGRLVDLPAMGTGERNLTAKDVRQALGLYGITGIVVFAIVGLITLLLL
jgi:adenosylcobinamide-phosphate synthase